jgi:hypothetical protein
MFCDEGEGLQLDCLSLRKAAVPIVTPHPPDVLTVGAVLQSIPPPRDQPVALVLRHLELLDGLLDRALLIRRVNNSEECG